jgi:hypothetical protein
MISGAVFCGGSTWGMWLWTHSLRAEIATIVVSAVCMAAGMVLGAMLD